MISVCMTTYNGELYLKEQIASILPQLSPDDELVICDDGSTDSTISIIESFEDPRIHLHLNHFKNHILNFESALNLAKGDILFLCDQDDVWMPDKIKTMLPYFDKYDLVCSNCIVTDQDLRHENKLFFDDDPDHKTGLIRNLWHNQYLGCCMAFNRKVLSKALPFPKNLITHDTWIGLVSEFAGRPKFINKPLIYFRRHKDNASSTCSRSRLSVREMVSYRLTLLKGLFINFIIRR